MQVTTFSLPARPGADASWEACAELDSPNTWVLAFCAPEVASSPEILRRLKVLFPLAKIMGCSTSGEIAGATLSDHSVSVAVVRFAKTRLRSAVAAVARSEDSRAAGAALGRELKDEQLRAIFLLSDGLGVNGSELVQGLNEILPPGVVVTGGLAGDGAEFRHTWILKDGEAQPGYVSAVGFYGTSVQVRHGSKGGWDTLGPERLVTKSIGNVLYELDGAPALDLYVKYLGERAAGLPATALLFPLSLRAVQAEGTSLVRTILAVDHEAKTMTFAGDIPQGGMVRLMRANFDRLVDGASQAAAELTTGEPSGPSLCIAVSCVGRRLVLGERTEEELEATMQQLAPGTRQIGFYSYGELSPFASGRCELHNQTMTLTTFSEKG
jgi:hypothetical protein